MSGKSIKINFQRTFYVLFKLCVLLEFKPKTARRLLGYIYQLMPFFSDFLKVWSMDGGHQNPVECLLKCEFLDPASNLWGRGQESTF